MTGLYALLAAAILAPPHTDYTWDCHFKTRAVCTARGCRSAPVSGWIKIAPRQAAYFRCDRQPDWRLCDQYPALETTSGAYQIYELPGRAAFAKIGPDLSILEVVTLGIDAYVSSGQCHEAGPVVLTRHN
jgi:hypothetical protein